MCRQAAHTWSCGGCMCAHVCVSPCRDAAGMCMLLLEGRGGCRPAVQPLFVLWEEGGSAGGWASCGLWEPCLREAAPQMLLFLLSQDKILSQEKPLQAPASELPHQCKCVCGSALHITGFLPWSRRRTGVQHGLLTPRNCPSPCTSLKVPAVSSSFLSGLCCSSVTAMPLADPCLLQEVTPSLPILKDLLVHYSCHQMVTAHGHFYAEPQHNAEAKDAARSLSLPGAGWFSHFLPFPSTIIDKGSRTCALLMQSCRKPWQRTSSHRGAACPS